MDQALYSSRKEKVTQSVNVESVLEVIWTHRRLLAVIAGVVFIPILALVALRPSHYQTSGTIIVGNLDPFSGLQTAGVEKLGDPADLESQLLIAKSPRMLRLAAEQAGVIEAVQEECQRSGGLLSFFRSPDCSTLKARSADVLNFMAGRYSVRAEGRSRVISIGYRSYSPEVAFILANALIITYLEDQRAENGPAREETAKWLLTAAKKINGSESQGSNSPKDTFYKNLYNRATYLETERRNLPNPARLVSFAEMPTGPSSKWPLLLAGLVLSMFLAGFIVSKKSLAERAYRLWFLLLPRRPAVWLAPDL